jgi:predicted flavoprotein YhiN
MFPVSDTSETIISCLHREASKYNVLIQLNREVKNIFNEQDKWNIEFADGEMETAEMVCVACGGYPKDSMFEWLKRTGHTVQSPVPS